MTTESIRIRILLVLVLVGCQRIASQEEEEKEVQN